DGIPTGHGGTIEEAMLAADGTGFRPRAFQGRHKSPSGWSCGEQSSSLEQGIHRDLGVDELRRGLVPDDTVRRGEDERDRLLGAGLLLESRNLGPELPGVLPVDLERTVAELDLAERYHPVRAVDQQVDLSFGMEPGGGVGSDTRNPERPIDRSHVL